MKNVSNAYFEEEILSASPLRLVCLLYQGAISELRNARTHLAAGSVQERCHAITKACNILAELTASLDVESGGDTAVRLQQLYGYCTVQLLEANLNKQDGPLADVLGVLTTLAEGWSQLANAERPSAPAVTSPAVYAAAASSQSGEFQSQSWSF